jgi:DNA modification methylase
MLVGDCLALLPPLDAESVDACVTDPPYELGFMGRAWDRRGVAFCYWAGRIA